jgi:hypothetical protein
MTDTTVADDLISDDMKALVGKVRGQRSSYPISASDIRKWAIAVYYPESPPAKFIEAGPGGLVAPAEFSPFAWGAPGAKPKPADIGAGFIERAAGITPPDVKFIVNGGSVVEYGVPMREGDVISTSSAIKSYTVKQGKRGPLLLTETQDRWVNQDGEMVKTTTMTLVRY